MKSVISRVFYSDATARIFATFLNSATAFTVGWLMFSDKDSQPPIFYARSSNPVVWQLLHDLLSKGSHPSVKLIYLKIELFGGQRGVDCFPETFIIRNFYLMELSEVIIVRFSQQSLLQISSFAKKFFIFIGCVFRQVTSHLSCSHDSLDCMIASDKKSFPETKS